MLPPVYFLCCRPANAQIHFPLNLRHYKESWYDGLSNAIKDMTLDDNLCIGTVTYGWDGRIILARPHISVIAPQTFVWWTIRYLCSTISLSYFFRKIKILLWQRQHKDLWHTETSPMWEQCLGAAGCASSAGIHATFHSPLSSTIWKRKRVKTLSLMLSFQKLSNCNIWILILTTRR